MKMQMIVATSVLVLVSTTGAFAQQMQYDRTGDHMFSYGTTTGAVAPKTPAEHHAASPQMVIPSVQYDRTGDHMNSYGPATQ
jgi:hypothetical protein